SGDAVCGPGWGRVLKRDVSMPGASALTVPQAITLEALEASFETAVAAGGGTSPDAAARAYLAQVHDDYVADETPELGGADLARLLASVWKSATGRQPGDAALITFGPLTRADGRTLGYDSIAIVQDDRPFLVDSVMGELAEAGVTVRSMF